MSVNMGYEILGRYFRHFTMADIHDSTRRIAPTRDEAEAETDSPEKQASKSLLYRLKQSVL